MRFANRSDAGRQLADRLLEYANRSDVIVLALPRGGVPVAHEVAARLKAPLDIFLVRKLGVPGHAELAMGAIAAGGIAVLSESLIRQLGIPRALVDQVAARERLELERRDVAYRGGRRPAAVRDRTVILIDDGLATGSTMEAAILALRQQAPARIVVAAPVGARETCERLGRLADRVVCVSTPEPFDAVGLWYQDFSQTTDDEVRQLLALSPTTNPERSAPGQNDAGALVRDRAVRLKGDPSQYDALLEGIGDARVVLLGEATHGTHEFYRERAFITRRLIVEKNFSAVAVEADWPDAYRINRYVRGASADEEAVDALSGFGRFPTWMWRNADVLDFVGWMRAHNEKLAPEARAGFYGLDLYSLRASMDAVLAYLDKIDPDGARRARRRYACFDQFGQNGQEYGYATSLGLRASCEQDAVAQLLELHRRRAEYASRDGRVAADEFFYAEQNARLVRNAEEYYRSMFGGRVESWNLRDRHMAETLRELIAFLDRTGPGTRVVVWAHNSHLGDARATEMGALGELNVGQLAREEYGSSAVLVGFTTYTGTVTAATEWDGPVHRRHVRPALPGSYERLFHEAQIPRFLLPLRTDLDLASTLATPRLERAIGVIYVPETERASHYFHARLPEQFDYVLHFDETRAVEPLERTALWTTGEVAETFPSGL
ncbi:MAG TPA: erythromycin esterase family protein [Vicinamibacterales bacterium]|jgi:erythromycin esterase-like protein/adenine/guanine phosphoribosyltransferase-like PRPP-binding protein|nr:erythromycin esterase family protein [Vicinamibacterales bacterium]